MISDSPLMYHAIIFAILNVPKIEILIHDKSDITIIGTKSSNAFQNNLRSSFQATIL